MATNNAENNVNNVENLTTMYGNSLVTAIADIGATEKTLPIIEDTTLTTAISPPATLKFDPRNGARIINGGGGSINALGVLLLDPLSDTPVFEGFTQKLHHFRSTYELVTAVTPITSYNDTTGFFTITGNTWVNNTPLRYLSTTIPISLFKNGATYYVVNRSVDNFQLSFTLGGAPIIGGAAGAIVHYLSSVLTGFYVDIATDNFIKPNHQITVQFLSYHSDGTTIGGLTNGANHYPVTLTDHTFKLAATAGGSALNITSVPVAVHSFSVANYGDIHFPSNYFEKATHGFTTGDKVLYWTDDTPIGNLTNNTIYEVFNASANALYLTTVGGSSAINILPAGVGVHYLLRRDIAFTGTEYPDQLSAELFANSVPSDKIKMADSALLGKPARILAKPRGAFDSVQFHVSENHTLHWKMGEYLNDYNGANESQLGILYPNSHITADEGVIFWESRYSGRMGLFNAFHLYANMKGASVRGLTIKGVPGAVHNGGDSLVNIGNANGGAIEHMTFERTHSYAAETGLYNAYGPIFAYNNKVRWCKFIDCQTQQLFCPSGYDVQYDHNDFIWRNLAGDNYGISGLIDIEPNDGHQIVDTISVSWNTFDIRPDFGLSYASCIIFNSARTKGIRNVTASHNTMRGHTLEDGANVFKALNSGVSLYGVNKGTVDSNVVEGAFAMPYSFKGCRDITFKANEAWRCQNNSGSGAALVLQGCRDCIVEGFKTINSNQGLGYAEKILELEIYALVSVSGAVVTHLEHSNSPHESWIGGTVTVNAVDSEVLALQHNATDQNYAVDPPPGDVSAKTFTVDTGTDVLTTNAAHGFNEGAMVNMSTTGSLPTPSSALTYENIQYADSATNLPLYVITDGMTSTTLQLARTLADAIAGTPVPINWTAAGSGTHTLTPLVKTKFSNHKYIHCDVSEIITEPTGTSVEYPLVPA